MSASNKELYLFDPKDLNLRLDETVEALKEFREEVPKNLKGTTLDERQVAYLQAILNIVDYLEIPQYLTDSGAEA